MKYDSNLANLHDELAALLNPILARAKAAADYTARQKAEGDHVTTWVNREVAESSKRCLAYLNRVAAAVETHFDDLPEGV